MLENTFLHISGIGKKTEKSLWKKGILSWSDFLGYEGTVFSEKKDNFIRDELRSSIENKSDISFFKERLSSAETWRLFDAFREKTVYLDIETSGGYDGVDEITVIGIYDGTNAHTFVNGINLEEFETAIDCYEVMVTFNGACFDIPFIQRHFRNISLPPAHIDLRFVLKRLGFKGGLKNIERELGIGRSRGIEGLEGYHAVLLWQAHRCGKEGALERLMQYNTADTVNLEPIMELAYKEMVKLVFPSNSF